MKFDVLLELFVYVWDNTIFYLLLFTFCFNFSKDFSFFFVCYLVFLLKGFNFILINLFFY